MANIVREVKLSRGALREIARKVMHVRGNLGASTVREMQRAATEARTIGKTIPMRFDCFTSRGGR